MHLFDKVDGEIRYRQQGPDRSLISADIPWTRIDAAGLAALQEVKSLRSISLSGIHFPTTFMDADALREIGDGGRCELLAVHGAGLLPAELKVLATLAPSLASLDLAGLPVSESLLSEILDAAPSLQQLSVGFARWREGHRFTPLPIAARALQKLRGLKRIERLGLRGTGITDDLLGDIPLQHLRVLDIGETGISKTGLARLVAAEGLQELHADNCPVADGAQLHRLRGLATITLSGTQVGDSTVRELSSLPHLKRVALDGISLSDDAISSLAKLDGLQALDLSSVSSKGIAILAASLSQLEELTLRVAVRNADDIAQLAKLTRLRELDLPIEADVRSWKALSGLSARIRLRGAQPPPANMPLPPNLVSIALSRVANPEALAPLLQSKSLERLFLWAGGAELRDLPPNGLPGLREFLLQNDALDDEGLSRLARCPRLEALYISGNRITDGGLAAIRNAQFLHTIELRDTEIGDAACETLLTLPALHCLDLPGTRVTEHGAARLAKAPNLQSLALDGRQVTPLSMHALAQLPSLIELYLYGTEVTTASIELAAGLPRLIELNLNNVKLDAAAVAAIARMSTLRVVRLSGHGPADFATALRAARPELVILGDLAPQQVADGSHRPNPGRVQLRNT